MDTRTREKAIAGGEELRAKFKAKAEALKAEMESPFGRFRCRLYPVVAPFAGLNDAFARKLFVLYEEQKPADLDTWMKATVPPMFVSLGDEPRWRFEPDWAFLDGEPLAFVSQYDVAGAGETFYVFKGVRETPIGPVRVTRLTAQGDAHLVRMEGEIVG